MTQTLENHHGISNIRPEEVGAIPGDIELVFESCEEHLQADDEALRAYSEEICSSFISKSASRLIS